MNITIQHTELGRFAHIETPTGDINVPLDDRLPTVQSLRRHAALLREKANICLAGIICAAADIYEHGGDIQILH